MYAVTRRNAIHEELNIQNLKGETQLTLEVDLRVDDVLAQYNRLRRLLGDAQEKLRNDPMSQAAQTAYGTVVAAFLELIFGSGGCKRLLDYYENRCGELLSDVAPFVVEVIQPQMEAAMKERVRRYRDIAKAARR